MSAGTSYLNSNVSLISKASIRYEGTLFSINPHEATITLSKVKSYGTEDRKVEKFLAPKDTLFEYIIFKANDIKELIVDEPVNEPLNDPAIVTATTSASSNANYSGFKNDNQSNIKANGEDVQAALDGNTNQTGAQSVSSAGQAAFRSRNSTPASSQARSPVSELSGGNKSRSDPNKVMPRGSNNNGQSSNARNSNNFQQRGGYQQNNMYNQSKRRPAYQNNYPSNYNRGPGGYRPRNDDRMPNHHLNNNNNNHNNNNRNGLRNNNFNPMNNNRNMMMRGGRKFVPHTNKKFDATMKTEFDFEKAQEEYQQMVEKLEDLSVTNGEKSGSEDKEENASRTEVEKSDKVDEEGNCYDKTKSFFDKISCEAIERSKGGQKRFDWKHERKLNAETFGLKITYRRPDGFRPDFRRPGGYNSNYNSSYNNGGYNNGNYNRNNVNQYRRNYNAPSQPRTAPRTSSS